MGPRTALSIDKDFLSGRECESLDFNTRQVISGKTHLVQCRIVRQQNSEFGLTRLISNWASKNLKPIFESTL